MSDITDDPSTWPVAQSSALAGVTPAVVIGLDDSYGYASVSGTRDQPEVSVHTVPSREALYRALARIYPRHHGNYWGYPRHWHGVHFFTPDEPLRLYLIVEGDDEEEDESEVAE